MHGMRTETELRCLIVPLHQEHVFTVACHMWIDERNNCGRKPISENVGSSPILKRQGCLTSMPSIMHARVLIVLSHTREKTIDFF